MDDCELALGGSFEQELLYCCGGSVCEDDLIGVNVFQCISGNLVIYLTQLINDLVDALQNLSSYVLAEAVARHTSNRRLGAGSAGKGVFGLRVGKQAKH